MLINESTLRKIIREEMANIDRGQSLITQDDVDEHGGYGIDRPAIPGQTTRDPNEPAAIEYEGKDDFQQIRLARLKAAGVTGDRAQKMSRADLKHRGKRPGHG
jgi:hypothetical protein